MFSPRSFIKKFQNKKKNSENDDQTANVREKRRSISYESDESVRAALLEIVIYIVFVVVTTVVANAAHHLYMFYFNQTLERSFLGRPSQTVFGSEIGFDELVTTADWWIFLETNFLEDLHDVYGDEEQVEDVKKPESEKGDEQGHEEESKDERRKSEKITERKSMKNFKKQIPKQNREERFRNNINLVNNQSYRSPDSDMKLNDKLQRLYLRDNILLGPPRLRQIRVKDNSCQMHEVFITYFNSSCYAGYSKDIENRTGVHKGTKFYTLTELKANPIIGEIATYYGAGYVKYLTFNYGENQKILKLLKEHKWIDRGTRIVILEFILFNVNAYMFDNVKIIAEITPVGGVVTSHQFQALKLHSIWTEGDVGLYIAGGIFYTMIVYYTIEEVLECRKIGWKKYSKSIWNVLDIIVIILSYLSLVYNIIHPVYLNNKLKEAELKPNDFISIDYICYWNLLYVDMMGICVFLCAKDLFGFAVMFFIVFLAYAQLGLLIFGTSHPDFREFGISVITLMRMFLGDFEYQLIEEANHVLGPIYFLTYVLFVFFILLNMFLAIINDTYGEVKSEVQQGHSNFGSYLEKIFRKFFPYFYRNEKKSAREIQDSLMLTEISDKSKNTTQNIYPSTSKNMSPTLKGRVRKRESEVLREYFEELPKNQQPIPAPPKLPKENNELQSLSNRITMLEEVLEQLIINMDRILKKVETKKPKRT